MRRGELSKAARDALRAAEMAALAADREGYKGPGRAEWDGRVFVRGRAEMFVAGRPPTVTHHAREIKKRGGHMTITDSPALAAAKDWYRGLIRQNSAPPLLPPVRLYVQFRFALQDSIFNNGWNIGKPDGDNAVKAVADALAIRGWIERDEQIAIWFVEKAIAPSDGFLGPGVLIHIETTGASPAFEPTPYGVLFYPHG